MKTIIGKKAQIELKWNVSYRNFYLSTGFRQIHTRKDETCPNAMAGNKLKAKKWKYLLLRTPFSAFYSFDRYNPDLVEKIAIVFYSNLV